MNYVKKNNSYVIYMIAFFTICILTAADQITKMIAVVYLKGNTPFVLIEGILELRYLENKGMAFGLFSGKIPFFVIICVVFLGLILYFLIRVPKRSFYYPVIAVALVLTAGAIGNFIDRVWHGYVIDFIYFKLINFPIFNLADIYVVISCVLLMLLIFFRYEDSDFKFLSLKCKER